MNCHSHSWIRKSVYKKGFKVRCHACLAEAHEVIDTDLLKRTGKIKTLRFQPL